MGAQQRALAVLGVQTDTYLCTATSRSERGRLKDHEKRQILCVLSSLLSGAIRLLFVTPPVLNLWTVACITKEGRHPRLLPGIVLAFIIGTDAIVLKRHITLKEGLC